MMNNKWVQVIIIAATTSVLSLIPLAGGCLACLTLIGLFLYFSKLQATDDPNYSIGSGIKFGFMYVAASIPVGLLSSMFTFDLVKEQMVQGLEQAGPEVEVFLDYLTQTSDSTLIFFMLLMGIVMNSIYALIFGLIAGLIFKKDEDDMIESE